MCEVNVLASMLVYTPKCNITTFRRENSIWPFDPTPWLDGVYKGRIFAFIMLYAQIPLI